MKFWKQIILGIIAGSIALFVLFSACFFIYTIYNNKQISYETSAIVKQVHNEEDKPDKKIELEEGSVVKTNENETIQEDDIIVTKDYFPLDKKISRHIIEEFDLPREFLSHNEGKKRIHNKEVNVVLTQRLENNQVTSQSRSFYSMNEDGDIYKVGRDNGKKIEWLNSDKQELILLGKMKKGESVILEEDAYFKASLICIGFDDVLLPNGDVYEDVLQVNKVMQMENATITLKNFYYKGVGLVYFEQEEIFKDGKESKLIGYVPEDSIQNPGVAFETGFISEDGIIDIVFNLDEVLSIDAPSISADIITYPTRENPIYEIKIYEDFEDHVATYNYYVFDGETGELLSREFDSTH